MNRKFREAIIIGGILVALGLGINARANDFYVSTLGDDARTTITAQNPATPWRTIQHAIDSIVGTAQNPHNIIVAEGIYTENITMNGYENLFGGYNKDTWERDIQTYETIINGNETEKAVVVTSNTTINGLTIQNAQCGVYLNTCESFVISSNTISNNYGFSGSDWYSSEDGTPGYGIYTKSSTNGQIICNTVSNNSGGNGGPTYYYNPGRGADGSGIYIEDSDNILVYKNTISEITGGSGGTSLETYQYMGKLWAEIYGNAGGPGNGYGIFLDSSNHIEIIDNLISYVRGGGGNSRGGEPGTGIGVFLSTSNNNIIGSNKILHNSGASGTRNVNERYSSAGYWYTVISDQDGGEGIGFAMHSSTTNVLENNIIALNSGGSPSEGASQSTGKGISINSSQDNILRNNTISYNKGHSTGIGIHLDSDFNTLINNIISHNYAENGDGYGIFTVPSIVATISYNDVSQNSTSNYFGISDQTGMNGNISSNPELFDPMNGDFHLLSDSPCIDAGRSIEDLVQDFEGDLRGYDGISEPRGDGSDFDIGADEFVSSPPNNHAADKPTNISPINGATGVSFPPLLESSVFSDPDFGDYHLASRWQVDDNGDFSSPKYDSRNDTINKTTITVPIQLKTSTQYHWRVRHIDNFYSASEWSNPTHFITRSSRVFTVPGDFPGIQAAINDDAVVDSDIVQVDQDTYYENINFNGKNIVLRSSNPDNPSVVENTIIDGNQAGSVVTFSGNELSTCVLSGFTITGGYLAGPDFVRGAGINGNGTRATIQNNIIKGNRVFSEEYGGASYGGGFYNCDGIIQNNIITGNSATGDPGQMAVGYGGALCNCNGIIQNNTIFENSSTYRTEINYCSGIIRNNIIWGGDYINWSSTPSYSCIQDWTGGGEGNIGDDPKLVDPANGNFHLRPDSPCIDAGCSIEDLLQDFEGDIRPYDAVSWESRGDGSDYDIGADEFIGAAQPTPTPTPTETPTPTATPTPTPSLTPTPSPTPWQIVFDFIPDSENWTNSGAPVIFSVPEFVWEPDYLKMISRTNTNTFGYWLCPQDAVPTGADYLYRARLRVSTDITTKSLVPQIRVRTNSLNLQQYDILSIESAGDGAACPDRLGTDYDLYFVPPANDTGVMIAFDLLNFNPLDSAVAELALDSVTVDRFALDSLSTPTIVQDYTFDLSTDGWATGGAPFVFSPPEYAHSGGALELRAITNTNTFGFWGNDPADIAIEADRLYRGTFEVRTDVTSPALVPEMRLRFNTGNLQASNIFGIASAGDGANSPGTTNTTYNRLYFLPPADCVGQDLLVSFDILNFSPGDEPTASLILDRATIETLEPPSLP